MFWNEILTHKKIMFWNKILTHKIGGKLIPTKKNSMQIHTKLWWKVADSLAREDRCDEAIAVYTTILDNGPDNVFLRTSLAKAYVTKGDYNQSLRQYEAAIQLQRTNFWLWHNLCEVYILKNDVNGAINNGLYSKQAQISSVSNDTKQFVCSERRLPRGHLNTERPVNKF
jgi:predicted Zn-dependent protease